MEKFMVHTAVWLFLMCLFCFQDHWLAESLWVELCLDGLLATSGHHREDVRRRSGRPVRFYALQWEVAAHTVSSCSWMPRANADLAGVTGGNPSLRRAVRPCKTACIWHLQDPCFWWGTEAFKFVFICGVESIWISILLWRLRFRWWEERLMDPSGGESVRNRQEPICQRL